MEYIFTLILGIVMIIIGIINRKGNISSLHYYHRKRVSEQDRLPFGKLVGLGTVIIGAAMIFMSGMFYLANSLNQNVYFIIGSVIFIIGLLIGLAVNFYAMIKYNKGIF